MKVMTEGTNITIDHVEFFSQINHFLIEGPNIDVRLNLLVTVVSIGGLEHFTDFMNITVGPITISVFIFTR